MAVSILAVFGAMTVMGVHDLDIFELDGNVADDPATLGDDWVSIWTDGGDALASVFVEDEFGAEEDTILTGGSTKDDLDITGWKWTISGPGAPQDKSDIVNAFAAIYADGGDTYLYFGADRWDTNGDSQIGFWFFQDEVLALGDGETGGGDPFSGAHTLNDVLVLSDFTQGGNIATIKVYKWVGSGGDSGGGTLDLIFTGVDCDDTTGPDDVCATVNDDDGVIDPPWTYTDKDGNSSYQEGAFYEGGVNLSAILGSDIGCFSSFLAETRASQSVDAQLDDFALGPFSLCDIEVTKDGDDLSKVGDEVDYEITIENTGGLTLYKQSITDTVLGNLTGNAGCGASLAPGATCTINVSRVVQAGDPDPLPNTVSVIYNSSSGLTGDEVTDSDDHSVNLFQPSITFDKTADTTLSKVGDPVNYTITLTNTSSADTPDLDCTITDALLGIDEDVTLASGDPAHVINEQYIIQGGDPDPLENTASVSCSPDGFPNVLSDNDGHSVDLFGPSITFDKTGDTLSKVGDTVNYTITLTNTSTADTPDLDCTITDTMLGVDEDVTLASGDPAHVINVPYVVQAGDSDPLENTANVTCSPEGFPNVLNDSDGHSVNLFQPSITFDKTGDPLSKVGDSVNYTITLTNTSSADTPDLDCTITDAMLGIDEDVTLASGDPAHVINDSRVVQAGDPDPLVNTASVVCSPDGFPNVLDDEDDHSVNLFQPSIEVTKEGPDYTKVGDANVYTVTIDNTSSADSPDLVLESIMDTLQGDLTDAGNVDASDCGAALAAGDSCEITYTYVTQASDDPGTEGALLSNTVSVETHPDGFPNDIDDSDTHDATILHPDYTVTKDCLTDTVPPGGTAIFEVVFTNTGDVDLIVTASEDLTDAGGTITAGTPFDLDEGASLTFEVSIVAGAGPIVENTVMASATLPAWTGLSNVLDREATDSCDVEGGATRTPGFWQTHIDYTTHIFEDHLGGTIDLGWKQVTSIDELMGIFWANNAKESDGSKRSKTCHAQMLGSFQLLAAILNTGLDNGAAVPIDSVTGDDLITAMRDALAAGDRQEILRLAGLLDAYNNSGDDIAIIDNDGTTIGRADPRLAKEIADIAFADC